MGIVAFIEAGVADSGEKFFAAQAELGGGLAVGGIFKSALQVDTIAHDSGDDVFVDSGGPKLSVGGRAHRVIFVFYR